MGHRASVSLSLLRLETPSDKKANAATEVKMIGVTGVCLSESVIVTESVSDLPMTPTKTIFQ